MFYLKSLEPLLASVTFLGFATRLNEDFTALDYADYDFHLVNSQSFDMTMAMWYSKCSNIDDKRLYKGYLMPFQAYAIHTITDLLNKDLLLFHQDENKDSRQLYKDFQALAQALKNQPYLSKISQTILKSLDELQNEFIPNSKNFKTKSIMNLESENVGLIEGDDYLIWNGSITQLCTLFHDFRTTKAKNGKVFFDYLPDNLINFIIKHFRDEEGKELSYHTIRTIIDPNREDKKAKKGRISIPENDV